MKKRFRLAVFHPGICWSGRPGRIHWILPTGLWILILTMTLGFISPPQARAGDCQNLVLETREPAYHIYPNHYGVCPDGVDIRCYHYHWDWICEKGDKLYWDRNLQAAALAACGCPMTPGLAQASPFVSEKPREDIFSEPVESKE